MSIKASSSLTQGRPRSPASAGSIENPAGRAAQLRPELGFFVDRRADTSELNALGFARLLEAVRAAKPEIRVHQASSSDFDSNLGGAKKAQAMLGWQCKIDINQLAASMVADDAKRVCDNDYHQTAAGLGRTERRSA